MNQRVLLLSCAVGALSLTSGSAFAAAAAAADTSQGATSVTEVIVTAEKRAANIQSVPETVTAFSAKERALKGINSVQDMTNFTPGFTYSSQLDRPSMRGLSRNNNDYLTDSSVAVYYDDVFSNSTFLVGRDDMLIDQVEILIGPQGTLYGRNAIGGLINTQSRRPTSDYSAEVRAMYGNYGYSKVEGTVSGPISDHLSFRVSVVDTNQTRGYFTNVAGGPSEGGVVHDPYVDAQLQYKNDKTEAWLDFNQIAFHHDRGGPGSLLGTPTAGSYDDVLSQSGNLVFNANYPYNPNSFTHPGNLVPGSVVGMIGTDNPALTNLRDFAHAFPTDINLDEAFNVSFHLSHHFDGFDVKYVGGYGQYHYNLHTALFGNDNSSITQYQIALALTGPCAQHVAEFRHCGPLTVYPTQDFQYETHTRWYSNEVTVSSTTNSPLQYIFGAYAYTEMDNNLITVAEHDQAQLASPITLFSAQGSGNLPSRFVAAAPNPSRDYVFVDYEDRIDSRALYGQLDWKIGWNLKLTGGLRFTYDQKSALEQARFIGFTNTFLLPQLLGSEFPAIDYSSLLIYGLGHTDVEPGITCGISLITTGQYAGDYQRCLGGHSSALTGTAGIEWTPDHDTLGYIRYNRGYKALGFNAGALSRIPEAAPEYVNDYEIGIKKTLFDHRLTVDLDGFYYDYINDQVPFSVPTGGVNLTQFYNIPKAVSDGVEVVADWRPIDHLDLNVTYAHDHTEIMSGCTSVTNVLDAPPGCYIDGQDANAIQKGARPVPGGIQGLMYQSVKGDQLPQAPENKVAVNANYTFVWEPGRLTLSGTFTWRDEVYSTVFRRSYYRAPDWNQVDLRATWSGNHDRYEVVAYIKNLFNTYGYEAAGPGFAAAATVDGGVNAINPSYALTPPRLYGLEVHYKF